MGETLPHVSSTWLVSRLRAVARRSRPAAELALPPQYHSQQSRIELRQVLMHLEELLDCLADEIVAEISQIQRCWDRYYGRPGRSTAAELVKRLGTAIDDAGTLDRAIRGDASSLLVNHQACSDEKEWIIGFRACSPHSHAVPCLQRGLNRFRNEMLMAWAEERDDAESREIFDTMWSSFDEFQIGKELFRTWLGETRARAKAFQCALDKAATLPVLQAADGHGVLPSSSSVAMPSIDSAWTGKRA
jgi:hypothetical protein